MPRHRDDYSPPPRGNSVTKFGGRNSGSRRLEQEPGHICRRLDERRSDVPQHPRGSRRVDAQRSRAAEAIDLALVANATLTLITVGAPPTGVAQPLCRRRSGRRTRDAAQQVVDAAAATVPDQHAVSKAVRVGRPSDEIVAAAREQHHDLIVMGSSRTRAATSLLLGSASHDACWVRNGGFVRASSLQNRLNRFRPSLSLDLPAKFCPFTFCLSFNRRAYKTNKVMATLLLS